MLCDAITAFADMLSRLAFDPPKLTRTSFDPTLVTRFFCKMSSLTALRGVLA
jgi:hypothetical protein